MRNPPARLHVPVTAILASSSADAGQHTTDSRIGKTILDQFSICACHPCAGAMLIFSVSFQFYQVFSREQLKGEMLQHILILTCCKHVCSLYS